MAVTDKDMGLKKLRDELKKAASMHVAVGIIGQTAAEAKKYYNAQGNLEAGPVTLAEVATAHEFGNPGRNIPERSFLRQAVDTGKPELQKLSAELTKAIAEGKLTTEHALGLLGQKIEALVDEQFERGGSPAWDPVKHRKGVPLSDTGQLKNSIASQVRKNGGQK